MTWPQCICQITDALLHPIEWISKALLENLIRLFRLFKLFPPCLVHFNIGTSQTIGIECKWLHYLKRVNATAVEL